MSTGPQGAATALTIQDLPVEQLRFDPSNPRLPISVDGSDEQAVLAWMLNEENLLELMGSIAAQGYFHGEPVLVSPVADHYIVVEGNRRLAAVLLLREPERAPVRKQAVEAVASDARVVPDALPALVYPTRDDILDYLGYRHVTGIKEWDPLAKARYVQQLRQRALDRNEEVTSKHLARLIGSRSDYVNRLLTGLRIYDHIAEKDFYGIEGVTEDAIQFAVLTTALSYEAIADFLEAEDGGREPINDENLRNVVQWMFQRKPDGQTVLGESRNLRLLAAVVQKPQAREALSKGARLEDAALLTEEPVKAFRKAVTAAGDKLRLARSMTHRITSPTESDLTQIKDLVAQARDLLATVRGSLQSTEDD